MIKINNSKNAPKPVGNYPHSIEIENILYLSGVGPRNYKDNSVPGNKYDSKGKLIEYDIDKQCHEVFKNVNSILEDSGFEWNNLIDITVFLTNMKKDFSTFNKIYSTYFNDQNCCRTTIEVNALPTDIAIELKCKAFKGKKYNDSTYKL